jgi:OOP family OmpA-OmpF porin
MASAVPEPPRVTPIGRTELTLKLVTGIAGTSLLAGLAWQVARAPLLSDLGVRTAEVMVANGITDGSALWISPGGWTSRVARLSGTADAATRERIRAAVAGLSGVHDALWVDNKASRRDAQAVSVDAALRLDLAACQTRINALLAVEAISFGTNDATIVGESIRQIDAIAQTLQRCPTARIAIVDRSPSSGGNAIAQALSQARADAVASALVERGIEVANVTATGTPPNAGSVAGAQHVEVQLSPGPAPAAQETAS